MYYYGVLENSEGLDKVFSERKQCNEMLHPITCHLSPVTMCHDEETLSQRTNTST